MFHFNGFTFILSTKLVEFISFDKIKPAVADHINKELPAHIEAAYAIATQSDWAEKVVRHNFIMTGIIALAAGPAPKRPDTIEVIIIIAISKYLGFFMLFCIPSAILPSIPVSDTIPAKNKNELIVKIGLKSIF